MKMSNVSAGRFLIDRGTDAKRASRTSWGEESYIKVSSTLSSSAYSILDYRAPSGFGVVRHLHHREDEVLHLVEGRIAVWMPDRCLTMTPGDLVFLPKGVEHAWRAYGKKSVRMNVTISPGGFEHFFPTIQARGLAAHNVEALTAVCDEFGIKVSGPLLSDEEIERIIALSDAGASGQRAAGEIE
jgi:mannose-6-phosphate isomerase-like protein (cupin superfamily)